MLAEYTLLNCLQAFGEFRSAQKFPGKTFYETRNLFQFILRRNFIFRKSEMGGGKVERTNDTNWNGKQEKATIKVSRTQREHDPLLG